MVDENALPQDLILREYRRKIANAIIVGDTGIFENPSPKHATIILEELIKSAKTSFIASAGKMNRDVWTDEVLRLLGEATLRGVTVKLLVESTCAPIDENVMPCEVIPVVRKKETRCGASSNADRNFFHLAVADGNSYRIELDDEMRTGAFCAHGPEYAATLEKWFRFEYECGRDYNAA